MSFASFGLIALLVIAALCLCGLAALIAGIVALVRIGASNGRLRGKGLAVAAVILGALMMLGTPVIAAISVPMLLYRQAREEVDLMESDRWKAEEKRRLEEAIRRNQPSNEQSAATIKAPFLAVDVEGAGKYSSLVGSKHGVIGLQKWIKSEVAGARQGAEGLSELGVLIRARKGVPYSEVQKVMQICAQAKVWRVYLSQDGGTVVPTPLARDKSLVPLAVEAGRIKELVLEIGVSGEKPVFRIGDWKASDATQLQNHLAKFEQVGDLAVCVKCDKTCPFKYVMQALDACSKTGMTNVQFQTPQAVHAGKPESR